MTSSKIKDRVGQRFGRLIVIEFSHITENKSRNAYWKCFCDCGNETIVSSSHLGRGTNSCGCIARENSAKRIKKLHTLGKHLYFIRCGEYVKIGRADNINSRMSQLKSMNPYPLELIKVLENEGYREKEFHEKYEKYHHQGEWYGCEVVDIGT